MTRRKLRRIGGGLGVALLLALATPVGGLGQQAAMSDEYVQDLKSMTGKAAPGFTLQDSEGKSYTVKPGDGRRHLVVFHMGSV